MNDREHEEWLENQNARKAAAKAKAQKPPFLKKKADEQKRDEEQDDQNGRIWRGENA